MTLAQNPSLSFNCVNICHRTTANLILHIPLQVRSSSCISWHRRPKWQISYRFVQAICFSALLFMGVRRRRCRLSIGAGRLHRTHWSSKFSEPKGSAAKPWRSSEVDHPPPTAAAGLPPFPRIVPIFHAPSVSVSISSAYMVVIV